MENIITGHEAIIKIESAFTDYNVDGEILALVRPERMLFKVHFTDDRFESMAVEVSIKGNNLDELTYAAYIAFSLVDVESKLKEWLDT